MALTKIITDTIDLSSDTTALKMPKGTTAQRPDVLTVDYLVVAGGGGGGWLGGGGGAGGYLTNSVSLSTSSAYSVIIGAGGSGGNSGSPGGGSGTNSKFTSSIEATGGGSGGGHATTAPGIGGSGGGGPSSGSFYNGAAGTTGQGNSGGDNAGNVSPGYGAGGGGGAGSAGVNGTSTTGGNGGNGLQNNLDGNNYYYAAGGGGGVQLTNTAGTGGSSIGGDGASDGNAGSNASPANRGSGGGGGGYSSAGVFGDGGNGSDGIIIISVPVNYTATFTSGVTANGVSGGGAISPNTATGYNVWVITVTTDALQTVTFSGTAPTIGTTRDNTTTGKMEIYTGAKGWRALQQTGQDVGIVPTNNFNTGLYTGNATNNSVDIGFDADLTWIKNRTSNGSYHILFDTVRGLNEVMHSDNDLTEQASGMSNSYSDGTLSFSGSYTWGNKLNDNYVAWGWKGGGAPTVSNPFMIDGVGYATAAAASMNTGTITPNGCSVNTETGFSIVTNTSPTGAYTWSHGLNKAPELWIHKATDYQYGWEVMAPTASLWGNSSGSLTPADWLYLRLDLTNSTSTNNFYSANNSVLSTAGWGLVSNFVTYCWHSVPGYSLIGMYTGTEDAANTPIIYTGFEPAWIMVKCVDSARAWNITDNKRNTTNPRNSVLQAQASDQEYTDVTYNINFYNDGFQIVNANTGWNISTEKYIFMCFAS